MNLQLNLRMLLCSILCTNLPRLRDTELIYINHRATKQLDVFLIFVEVNGTFCLVFYFPMTEVFYTCVQRATLFSLATLSHAHESHQCPD